MCNLSKIKCVQHENLHVVIENGPQEGNRIRNVTIKVSRMNGGRKSSLISSPRRLRNGKTLIKKENNKYKPRVKFEENETINSNSKRIAKIEPMQLRPRKVKTETENVQRRKCTRITMSISSVAKKTIAVFQHTRLFQMHTIVWAKMRGHRHWPASIIDIISDQRYRVRFFGSNDETVVNISNVYQYCDRTLEALGNFTSEKLSTKDMQFKIAIHAANKLYYKS